jgi:hypothetical protein
LVQLLLIVGFIRHMKQETEPLTGVEPWVKAVYFIGLGILPAAHFLTAFFTPQLSQADPTPLWPLLLMVGYGVIGAVAFWRGIRIPGVVFLQLDKVFSLRWIDRIIGWAGKVLEQLVAWITLLLEGDGGMLWALVFLVMLISVLGQVSGGMGG